MDPDDTKDLERYIRDKGRAKAKGKLSEVAQFCNCIGEIYSKYGHYDEAKEEHIEEKGVCDALADRIGEAVACRKIGECYCALGQYKEALEQQKLHLTLARECQNDLEEQRAWATIGRTYLCQAESRNVMESSLANKRAEKAFFKALDACEKVKTKVAANEYMAMKGRLFLNIGLVYESKGDLKQSADAMKKAVMIAEKYKLDNELQMCQASLGAMYHNGGKYTEAIRTYEVALKIAQKLRDKIKEKELLISKAMIHVAIGDFLEAKHCLKKAHKLKLDGNISTEKLRKLFRAVTKIQEAKVDLENTEDEMKACHLHETIADCLVELGNCKEAIVSYLKVLSCSHLLSNEKKAAIYSSLAQTYADERQYNSAVFYYKKELEIQRDNPEQCCRTNLNIAELEELNGSKYSIVCKIYMEAFDQAKKAKHVKLMFQTLKSLIELQKLCQQQKHLDQSEKTLTAVKKKYGDVDTEESQEEEDCDGDVDKDTDETENMSLSDLTVSDESDDDNEESGAIPNIRKKKSNFSRTNEKGETPLHRACIDGNLKKVKALVSEGHPLNPRDYCGWIPLHEAANNGHPDVVQYLLENGAWINDRGGERCGGVTPLIDAANCGNLEVIQILLNHGANVHAKDDDGNTALDSLQAWYNRAIKVLGACDVLEYRKTEKLLLDCSGWSGSSYKKHSNRLAQESTKTALVRPTKAVTHRKAEAIDATPSVSMRLPDLTDSDEDEEPQQNSSTSVKAKLSEMRQRRIGKKAKSCSHNRDRGNSLSSNGDSDLSDLESYPLHHSSMDITPINSNNATKVYQNAIQAVRSSAQMRIDGDDICPEATMAKTKSDQIKAPYMQGEEDVGDDWLVNDIDLPKGKKRSADVTKIFTTSSTRSNERVKKRRISGNERTDKKPECNIQDTFENSFKPGNKRLAAGSDENLLGSSRLNTYQSSLCANSSSTGNNKIEKESSRNKIQTTSDEELWGSDEDFFYENDSLFLNPIMENEKNISVSVETSSRNENEGSSNIQGFEHQVEKSNTTHNHNVQHSKDETVDSTSGRIRNHKTGTEASSSIPIHSSDQIVSHEVKLTFKVKIDGKTLIVPVYAGDENKSAAWLAMQVADRYFSSFLIDPMLTFKSPDGCIISPSDPICVVMVGTSELHADVHAWCQRTALERYEKACKIFYKDPNPALKSALQKVEKNKRLNLSNLGIDLSHLLPVFRALEGEKTLLEVNLNGNRLTDSSLDSLTKFLAHSCLKELKLESNDFSAEGLEVLASFVHSGNYLTMLTSVSLSYNKLKDGAEPALRHLLKGLPHLTDLRIAGCCFTPQLFTPSLLKTFSGCPLESLIISENQLTKKCLQSIFGNVRADALKRLDISQCLQEEVHGISLESVLQPIASHELGCLQTLSLAGCYLSREDILGIIRVPLQISTIKELDISLSPNVSNACLQKLLYLSAGKGCRLQSLIARGCSIRSPISEEFTEALKKKLQSDFPLEKFVFSCRALTSAESDILDSVWCAHWLDLAIVKVSGSIVNLSTKSLTEY